MIKVGLTYDLKTDYKFKKGDPPDANAEFDHPSTIGVIEKAILSHGVKVKRIGNVSNLIEDLNNLDVDIVFNISEGLSGRNRESQVPILLEMAGIPFVGSDALTLGLTLDKIIAKKIFISEKIPTPKFFEVKNIASLKDSDHLKFPLIVKPRFEGSSKGVTESSRVANMDELTKQAEFIINAYKQPALVEEFIKGSEFTVAVIGNENAIALPPVQIEIEGKLNLGDKFYTFEHINDNKLFYICPPKISPSMVKKLQDLALKTYHATECLDFARVDFRVDKRGKPFVLEINPLPSLSTEDVFMFAARAMGTTYEDLIGRVLKSAIERNGLN